MKTYPLIFRWRGPSQAASKWQEFHDAYPWNHKCFSIGVTVRHSPFWYLRLDDCPELARGAHPSPSFSNTNLPGAEQTSGLFWVTAVQFEKCHHTAACRRALPWGPGQNRILECVCFFVCLFFCSFLLLLFLMLKQRKSGIGTNLAEFQWLLNLHVGIWMFFVTVPSISMYVWTFSW